VVSQLRRRCLWLDRKISETVAGTAKHNNLRAEWTACDTAARELEARASVREVARVILRVADGLANAPHTVSANDRAFLWAWATTTLTDEAWAKAEEAAAHSGGAQ
jgi:hypothetical protein